MKVNYEQQQRNNVEGLYIAIIWRVFFVFALNVVAIYSTPKDVKFLCDDKVVKLSYLMIVSFQPFTLIVEWFLYQCLKMYY